MKEVGYVVLSALLLVGVVVAGCSREARLPGRRVSADRVVRSAPDWGAPAEGLQCRLRPTKRLWLAGEILTFKLDLRNQGKRLFAFDVHEPIHPDRVAIDGRWYHRHQDQTKEAKIRPLEPGTELSDLTLAIPRGLAPPLGPGWHTIQVALDLEDITVISGPVRIEIAPPPAETGS